MNKIQIIKYTAKKVQDLLKNHPALGHDVVHVARVATWARLIASREKARLDSSSTARQANVFLSEMSGWLHDIGRTKEIEKGVFSSLHHEISYEMCREWFRSDSVLNTLSKKDKEIILYAVRYHWNNAANKYPEAIILRDADKLDILGSRGVKRAVEYWHGDEINLEKAFRMVFSEIHFIMTKTAQKIVKDQKMIEPMEKFYFKLLKKRIAKIEL